MGDALVIEFQLEYDGRALTRAENAPHLMAWTSLPGRTKSFAPLLWRDAAKLYSKPVTVKLLVPLQPPRDDDDDDDDDEPEVCYKAKERTFTLPLDTTIGLQVRCDTLNDEGRIAVRNCGEALLPLGLELEVAKNDNARLRERRFELELVYHTHQNKDGSSVVKGCVVVSKIVAYLLPVSDGAARVDIALRSDGVAGDYAYLQRNLQFFNSEYQQMVERAVAVFVEEARAKGFDLEASSKEVCRVHAPTYATCAGPNPGFAFVMAPLRASIVPKRGTQAYDKVRRWLRTIAQYALRRENMSEAAFVTCVTAQAARRGVVYDNAFTVCAGIFGQMLAIPPTSTPYIGDFILVPSQSLNATNPARSAAPVIGATLTGGSGGGNRASIHRPLEAGNCEAKLDRWQPASANGHVSYAPIRSAEEQRARRVAALPIADGPESEEEKKLRVAVEAFNELVDYLSGDCEDLGCFSVRICNTLARTDWDAEEDALVAAMALLARQYVPFLTLTSVRSAAIGNDKSALHEEDAGEIDSERDRSQKYGAHMFALLLPVHRTLDLVSRTVSDLDRSALLDEAKGVLREPWTTLLPSLVVEGTGMVTSLLRPPQSYIVTGGPRGESVDVVRAATLHHVEETARVYRYLEDSKNSQFLGRLPTVRQQAQQTNKPNYRLTKFYRQLTHLYTDWFLQFGYGVVDFIAGNVGRRVPPPPAHSPSALRFDDNPQLGAFISPSAAAAHVSPKNLPPSAAPRPSSGNKRFLYGTPLEDMLESVLLERTALLPGTRVDARNMRVIATLLRHSPPITMPGNFEEQWQLQEARIASRRADAGVDEHAVERDVDRRLETLSTRLRTLTKDAKWRTNDADHTLHTFVLVAAMFSADSAVDNLCADIERHVRSGVVVAARALLEESLPHMRNVVLQLLADPSRVPAEHK